MNDRTTRRARRAGLLWALCLLASPAVAQDAPAPARPDNYDEQLRQYLLAARSLPDPGSLNANYWMTGLLADLRARRLNDLVTVRVTESVSAQGSADSNLDKSSNGTAALPSIFGLDSKFPSFINPANLATGNMSTTFQGGGSTNRAGTLSAVLTARVAEVLPTGDLAIEGIREIDINGDRQIIVLTGIVRPVDIGPGNVVLSTSVGQMRIRYFGQGLIRDNLKPGWLVRLLNKLF